MARLGRFKTPKINTVIGSGTRIEGDLKFTGGLHVDGVIIGNVLASGEGRTALILSEQGVVEGDVKVPNIVLNGKVVGDVYSNERLELASNARVTGTLYYKLLEMAIGAEVNGQLISSEKPPKARKDVPKDASAPKEVTKAKPAAPEDARKEPRLKDIQAAAGSLNTGNS